MSGPNEKQKRKRSPIAPNERRTIYLSNLPKDLNNRELNNMLNFIPGFVKSHMYSSGKVESLSAFALFDNPHHASEAMHRLQDYLFDVEQNIHLQIKWAQNNLHSSPTEEQQLLTKKRKFQAPGENDGITYPSHSLFSAPPMSDPYRSQAAPPWSVESGQPNMLGGMNPLAGMQGMCGLPQMQMGGMNPMGLQGMPQWPGAPGFMSMQQPSMGSSGSSSPPPSSGGGYSGSSDRPQRQRKDPSPPTNTLFLAKLDKLNEKELISFISLNCNGYKNHKFTTDSKGQRVAFVQFDSVELAAQSIPILNGHRGLQVTFSRNPLNQRAEAAKEQQAAAQHTSDTSYDSYSGYPSGY